MSAVRRRLEEARAWSALGRRLAGYTRGRRGRLGVAFVMTLGMLATRLLEPWPLKLVFDNVLAKQPLPSSLRWVERLAGGETVGLVAVLVGAILILGVASGFFYYWTSVITAKVGNQVVAELRRDVYAHVQRMSLGWHSRRQGGDILVRLIADIRLLRDAIVGLPMNLAENVLLVAGMAVIMLIMDWQLALTALALLPFLAVALSRFRGPMKEAIRQQRRQEGELADTAMDSLGAMRAVQGYGLEERDLERFGGSNTKSMRQGVKAARLEARLKWATDVAAGVVIALVVGLAAWKILHGKLSPGSLVVFVSYLRAFARPLRRISRTAERIARTTTAGERILELLDIEPEIRDRPGALEAPPLRGEIELRDVTFAHRGGPPVLHEVSLRIGAGERIGVVGPTGAGKTTLLSLVARFADPASGAVLVDGHDVRDLRLSSLRGQISFVFQEPTLFATTVRENIADGRPGASDDEVVDAARRAGIHDVIAALPDGYDTLLGERGGTLSGGQRQCVAIARAMLRNAPIVILDEPTTGLDARSAAMVMDAVRRLMEGHTVILISHDLPRLRDTDRILVLERGRIVQEGRWEDLAARAGLFRDLERVDAREQAP